MTNQTGQTAIKPRVLFVLHQASLTGAPIILAELVKYFVRKNLIDCMFLVVEEGPLLDQCRSIAETHIWHVKQRELQFCRWGIMGKPMSRIYNAIRQRRIFRAIRGVDVVVSNTIANGAILERLAFLECPVVSYIHELPFTVRSVTSTETLKKVLDHTHFFFAGSLSVRDYLIDSLHVDRQRTAVLYSSIDVHSFNEREVAEHRTLFRKNHMIPETSILVGVASTAEWRKGFDFWFPLVKLYSDRFPDRRVVFVWKGYRGNMDTLYADLFDFRKSGLADRVILLPHDGDSRKTTASFDIHLLLSREDPYPLVVLEAACMGIPTVCFRNAGGAPEFVEDDAGVTVPYGDISELANVLDVLAEETERRKLLGQCAREKVVERHAVENAARKMLDIIRNISDPAGKGEAKIRLSRSRKDLPKKEYS